MRPFLTLPTLGSIDARAEEGELNHQLLVVNPNGEQWANSIVQTSATVRLSMCRLFYSSSDAYLVEDATNGNGASLCNISESINSLGATPIGHRQSPLFKTAATARGSPVWLGAIRAVLSFFQI